MKGRLIVALVLSLLIASVAVRSGSVVAQKQHKAGLTECAYLNQSPTGLTECVYDVRAASRDSQ